MRSLSVPRLELMGALMGAQLGQQVQDVLGLKKTDTYHWVDSIDVLCWLRGPSKRLKPFVANRVGELQDITDPNQWKYVPTKLNPADCASRGLIPSELIKETIWWKGPEFLKLPEENWPQEKVPEQQSTELEVRKKFEISLMLPEIQIVQEVNLEEVGLKISEYSSLNVLLRKLSWILRFISNMKNPQKSNVSQFLQAEEIQEAEKLILRVVQQEEFPEEVKNLHKKQEIKSSSKIAGLLPWLDEEKLLRANTRLSKSDFVPWESRYPIILPKSHHLTYLIVMKLHEDNYHSNISSTMIQVNARYWIPAGREVVKKIIKNCSSCILQKAKPVPPQMAPLPAERTEQTLQAFETCSVDYGGPYLTRQGRSRVKQKRYICLFSCLTCRAVHIEMAFNMSTEGFLSCLSRMIARRGTPRLIMSDNGTTFVKADKEIKEIVSTWKEEQIQRFASKCGIKWQFNPPHAPHFGGVHESMIKCAKKALSTVLTDSDIDDEELMTALIITEGLLNSRPLTVQLNSINEILPLTPNHFLTGRSGKNLSLELKAAPIRNLNRRWKLVQQLTRHVWKRWLQEWLPTLRLRNKWKTSNSQPKVGDIVLVIFEDMPKGHWPLGRITAVFHGSDNIVRVVDVLLHGKTYRRPVIKVCPLPFQEIL